MSVKWYYGSVTMKRPVTKRETRVQAEFWLVRANDKAGATAFAVGETAKKLPPAKGWKFANATMIEISPASVAKMAADYNIGSPAPETESKQ